MGSSAKIDRSRVTLATEVERLCWEKKLGASRHRPWDAIDAIGDIRRRHDWLKAHGRDRSQEEQRRRDPKAAG
jgi:hypothetical protein